MTEIKGWIFLQLFEYYVNWVFLCFILLALSTRSIHQRNGRGTCQFRHTVNTFCIMFISNFPSKYAFEFGSE